MSQRKEMVHNALTGGKAPRQCGEGQPKSRGRLARSQLMPPSSGSLPFPFWAPNWLPHPYLLLQPLPVDHVPLAPPQI